MQSLGRGKDRARRIDAEDLATGKEARPPRVLRTFAIYTAVAFLIAVLAIAFFVRNNGRAQAEQKVAEFSAFAAGSTIASSVPQDAWNAPLTGDNRAALEAAIKDNGLENNARTVKLYGPNGELIFSNNDRSDDEGGQTGELRTALAGEPIGSESTASDGENEANVINGFAPVVYPGSEQPAGAVEIVVDSQQIIGPMRSLAAPMVIALLLIMLGLYIALWPLLRRTTRQLSYSYNELRRRADDLDATLKERAVIENRLRDTIIELERSEMALAHSQEETIMRLSLAVESRDAETGSHIERMGRYCALIASKLGWTEQECELLRIASPLHDVGKIAIPDAVLQKPGKLTDDERKVIQTHAQIGHKILAGSDSPLLDLAARIALTHHEHWDGNGYPNQLVGEEIPLEGRIAAIADVFDALTSDRVYRKAMTVETALAIMSDGRGTHFDPALLDIFIDSIVDVLRIRDGHVPGAVEAADSNGKSSRRRRKRSTVTQQPVMAAEDDGEQRRTMVG